MTRRTITLATLMVVISLVIGALIAELALRVYVRVGGPEAARLADFDPINVKVVPFGTIGYRQRPHASFRYFNGTVAVANSLGYRGPEITRKKPAGTARVVLMGGSTTHGWGVNDDHTIDAHMRRQLSADSSRRFEVINAALDGYDSRQLLERLQADVLHLEPDLVIINCGINDVRNARFQNIVDGDPRTLIWRSAMEQARHDERYGPSWWTMAKHYSLALRLPSFVRTRMLQSEPPDTTSGYPDAANYFENNLRRIAQVAAQHDIKLIFSTPPSSLRTRYAPKAPPEKSYWLKDAATTADYRDTLAARMQRVAAELSAKGQVIPYLRPELPPEQFLDDAHLTSEGNATMAAVLVPTVRRLLRR